jgi:hypothetical protein
MYSPRIPDAYIPLLYRLARRRGAPMTALVAEAVAAYLEREAAAAPAAPGAPAAPVGPDAPPGAAPAPRPGRRRAPAGGGMVRLASRGARGGGR